MLYCNHEFVKKWVKVESAETHMEIIAIVKRDFKDFWG